MLAGANDAARSDRDFESVPERVIPLAAVSLRLAGTTLLSACLARLSGLAALACLSTPFDLAGCSAASGRPHKAFSQRWLVRRLRQ